MSTLTRSQLVASVDQTAQAALDLARRSIDALGGSAPASDRYSAGYNRAIDDAITILDQLGAKHPAIRALDRTAPLSPGAIAAYAATEA